MRTGTHARPTLLEAACLVVGVVLTIQYAWLQDDAYVYFKYVDNALFLQRGLVYNPGEYVEGSTSPLWTLLLLALRATTVSFWTLVRGVGVVSFVAFWWGLVRLNRRLAPPGTPVVNAPLLLLTLNHSVLSFFTSGTESPVNQLLALAYAGFMLTPGNALLQAALAVSPLSRHEFVLPLAVAIGWAAWRDRRAALRVALAAGCAGGAWLLFRVWYYADVFPVTFYLKNQSDPAQGLRYLHDTLQPFHLYAVFGLFGLGALWCRRHGRALPEEAARGAMLVAAGVVVAWVVRIGGDAQHYRYLAFPVCLAVTSLGGIAEAVLHDAAWPRRLAVAALAGVTLLAYPRQLDRHPLRADVVPSRVDGISDATHHRVHPELPRLDPWGSGAPIELLPRYRAWIAGGADPRTTTGPVVPDYICWRNYRYFERRSVHSLGLADAVLAHTAMPLTLPGHKFGLVFMAGDLARLEDWWGRPPDRGMFRAAVAAGVAPPWVVANVDTLEAIADRAFNRHDLAENLRLALTPVPPIVPSPALRDLAEQSRGTVK